MNLFNSEHVFSFLQGTYSAIRTTQYKFPYPKFSNDDDQDAAERFSIDHPKVLPFGSSKSEDYQFVVVFSFMTNLVGLIYQANDSNDSYDCKTYFQHCSFKIESCCCFSHLKCFSPLVILRLLALRSDHDFDF